MKLIIYFIYSHPKIMQKKIPLINVKRQKKKKKKKEKKGLHLYESVALKRMAPNGLSFVSSVRA